MSNFDQVLKLIKYLKFDSTTILFVLGLHIKFKWRIYLQVLKKLLSKYKQILTICILILNALSDCKENLFNYKSIGQEKENMQVTSL